MEKQDVNNRFLEAIDALLEANNSLTKGEIANKLNIKPAKFSEILNCRMNIGVDLAALICIHYDVSPNWLLIGRGGMFQNSETPTSHASDTSTSKLFIEKIAAQAEEIGMLKQQVKQLTEKNTDASSAICANVG